MKTLYIKDLQKNQVISNEVFLIFECTKSEDKNGKPYCSLIIGDKTGKIPAKIWGDKLVSIDPKLLKGEILVSISGKVEEFKGNLQMNIYDMTAVDETKLDDYLQSSEFDPDEMMDNLLTTINEIKTESIKEILKKIITDEEINKRLKYWPAAASVHHDFRSGLLQHISEMIEIAKSMKKFYPRVNYDILTAGIVLHDIGKLYELDGGKISVTYSKEGMLVGHIVKGVLLFESFGGKELPEDIYLHIVHLILSHHGTREYGSPVVPSTVEAIMLTYIDNLSAKSRTAMKARENIIEGDDFGGYNNFLEGAKLWRGGDLVSSDEEDSQKTDDSNNPDIPEDDLSQLTF